MKKETNLLLIGSIPHTMGSKNYGGVADVTWSLAKSLEKNSEEFIIFAIGRYYKSFKVVDKINIYGFKFSLFTCVKAIITVLSNIKYFSNSSVKSKAKLIYAIYLTHLILIQFNPKKVHIHHSINQMALAFSLIDPALPILLTIHSYSELLFEKSKKTFRRKLTNANLQYAIVKHVTFVSNSLVQQALSLGLKLPLNYSVIYNGMAFGDATAFKTTKVNPTDILFVGSFIDRKGINVLMKSLNRDDNNCKSISWIGKGPLEATISIGLKKEINSAILGQLSKDSVYFKMAQSKLLVVPSKSESFGLVYIEALFWGTPIIGYSAVMKEFISYLKLNDKESKWLIGFDHSSESAETLSKKINFGLTIKENYNYMEESLSIKSKIIKNFSWEKIVKDYIEIYNAL